MNDLTSTEQNGLHGFQSEQGSGHYTADQPCLSSGA
jgi:hypothetical protein